MKMIKKTIDIDASPEKVWNVLVEDNYNRQWFSEFSVGTTAQSDWKEGSRIKFTDEQGMGIAGVIEKLVPNEYISIGYDTMLNNGEPDLTGPGAHEVNGMHENYKLTAKGSQTELYIESDMDEQHLDTMSQAWDRALAKVKALAESQS